MTFRLCTIDPPEILKASPVEGFPPSRSIGNPSEWLAPDGCRYLPVTEQAKPTPSNPETHRLERLPDEIVGDEIHANLWREVAIVARIPEEVDARQFKLAIHRAGIPLASIEAALGDYPEFLIEWKTALYFHRSRPEMESFGALFGMNAAALDALFIAASKI